MEERICKKCGFIMTQIGSERNIVTYHCKSCGFDDYVEIEIDSNMEYWQKRSALLGRVRKGIIDCETVHWGHLRKDIVDFTNNYEAARCDIYFMIGLIASMTSGFTKMDSEKYKECKAIFKATEKVYKKYCKDPKGKENFHSETGNTDMEEYKQYRQMYRKCRYEYQKEFLGWKIVYSLFKFLVPKII